MNHPALVSNVKREEFHPAHRAILYQLARQSQQLDAAEAEVVRGQQALVPLLNNRDRQKREVQEMEDFLLASKFTVPEGFDLWGNPLES